MRNSWIDNRIRHEFRSRTKLLLHFSVSLIQLSSILAILSLQIILIMTQTCVYHIAVGFWIIPFLLISPTSIWIVIWRRSSIACFIAIITHLIGALFSTPILIISFLVLIGQIECSRSSVNMYYIPLNTSFIGIVGLFKIFNYLEVILLYKLRRNTDQIPTIFTKDPYIKDFPFLFSSIRTNKGHSWSTISRRADTDLDELLV